ncbi:SBBP repeat-containing protein [Planctomyces sp. SH-PL62]|uniref:SBBP repeat-containing protein n=1 Tax=Planctomyces sp. SH-PL62 TaxID=1636152 RepID=UPI00078ED296|nr:SBBP repeat-containing protein [Planctomyces sp. SH-PL62]AMV36845.1 Beta-propeller repeat protein [Planctomyces sp. SH-PL62]
MTRFKPTKRVRPAVEPLEGRALLSFTPLSIGATSEVGVSTVATDTAGAVYPSGTFTGTVDFEPQDGPDAADTLRSHVHPSGVDLRDGFVAKYTPNGDLLWPHRFGGANAVINSGDQNMGDLVIDIKGNAYVTGSLRGSDAEFGDRPDGTPAVLSAHGPADEHGLTAEDAFLAKLDPDGATLWAIAMGGSGTDVGGRLDLDPAGNVYTAGSFEGAATFGTATLTSPSVSNLFLMKHTPDGEPMFVKQANNVQTIGGLDVTSGGIHLTGAIGGTIDADPGPSQRILTAENKYQSMYLIKLGLGGDHVWSFNPTGSRLSSTFGTGVTVDDAGNVYVTGLFHDQVDFDPSGGKANLSGGDTYVAKYSSAGAYQWAKALTLNGGRPESIKLDGSGNIYLSSWFNDTADFDPGKAKVNRVSAGMAEGFLLKLNASGAFSTVRTFRGAGWDSGKSLAIDASGRVYVVVYTLHDEILLRSLS